MTTRKAAIQAKKTPAKSVKKTAASVKGVAETAAVRQTAHTKHAKKTGKESKKKVVRDSFTMPEEEYLKIAEIKSICQNAGMHVKKSEVLRAGLKLLSGASVARLKRVLGDLPKIKTGRPKKH